jgi:hypothetical protein
MMPPSSSMAAQPLSETTASPHNFTLLNDPVCGKVQYCPAAGCRMQILGEFEVFEGSDTEHKASLQSSIVQRVRLFGGI